MLPLDGRVIVVIGGSSGLGLSAAKAFASCGARLVLVGRSREKLENAAAALGSNVIASPGDAADPDTSDRAVRLASEHFGRLDALYHVAGGSGRRFGDGPLHEITDDGVDATLDLNLKPVLYSNRAAVRQFLAQNSSGTVLNMASVLGFSPAPKYFATHVYAAAKAAIIGLTKSAAAFYAPKNIRFNVIAPALVDTPMAARAMQNQEITEYIRTKQPLDGGRAGVPADADAAAVWFMSGESRFVTGQVLAIDGGWSVCEGQY